MDIVFSSRKQEKAFNSKRLLEKEYGESARAIMRRMSVLRAASTLADVSYLKPERRHQLTGNRKNEFAVDLKHPYRLTFKPNHNPIPKDEDDGIDLNMITAIKILKVEDYHK